MSLPTEIIIQILEFADLETVLKFAEIDQDKRDIAEYVLVKKVKSNIFADNLKRAIALYFQDRIRRGQLVTLHDFYEVAEDYYNIFRTFDESQKYHYRLTYNNGQSVDYLQVKNPYSIFFNDLDIVIEYIDRYMSEQYSPDLEYEDSILKMVQYYMGAHEPLLFLTPIDSKPHLYMSANTQNGTVGGTMADAVANNVSNPVRVPLKVLV